MMALTDDSGWVIGPAPRQDDGGAGLEFHPSDGEDRPSRSLAAVGIVLAVALLASAVAATLYGLGLLVKLQLDRYLGS